MFIGRYVRKVQRGGWVRFPKDLLLQFGENREVFIMPGPSADRPLVIFPAAEFNRKLKRLSAMNVPDATLLALGNAVEQVKIAADGRMRISARMLAYAGIRDGVCFSGEARKITVTAIQDCRGRLRISPGRRPSAKRMR